MKQVVRMVLATLVTLPIWMYLLYKILVAIEATELMWFLYWIYLPTTMIVAMLTPDSKEPR